MVDDYYDGDDLIARIVSKRDNWRNFRKKEIVFSNSIDSSDSEFIGFEVLVSQILKSENKLKNFRRIRDYRNILEHVSYFQGKKYLDRINKLGICGADKYSNSLKNEKFVSKKILSSKFIA